LNVHDVCKYRSSRRPAPRTLSIQGLNALAGAGQDESVLFIARTGQRVVDWDRPYAHFGTYAATVQQLTYPYLLEDKAIGAGALHCGRRHIGKGVFGDVGRGQRLSERLPDQQGQLVGGVMPVHVGSRVGFGKAKALRLAYRLGKAFTIGQSVQQEVRRAVHDALDFYNAAGKAKPFDRFENRGASADSR